MRRRDRVPVLPDTQMFHEIQVVDTQMVPDARMADVRLEVYAAIDDALARFQGRAFVSGAEVVDILLDLRSTVEIAAKIARIPAAAAG